MSWKFTTASLFFRENVRFHENCRWKEVAKRQKLLINHSKAIMFITIGILVWDFFIGTKDKTSDGLFEVVIELDVDQGINHGVWISQHIDPELEIYKPVR